MSLATKLATLDAQRDALAANLTTKGITASNTETLAQLVPKILEIPEGGAAKPSVGIVPVEWDMNGYPTKVETYGIAAISGNFFRYSLNVVNRNVQEVIIDNAATSIAGSAFYDCVNLINVTLPNTVITFGDYSFKGCTNLTSIIIPAGLTGGWTSLTYAPFTGCTNLSTVILQEGMTRIPGALFRDLAAVTAVTIPSTITQLGDWCFLNCTGLTSVTIPVGLTGGWSSSSYPPFQGCTNLSAVILQEGMTRIPSFTFRDLAAATSITIPSTVTQLGDWCFLNCTGLMSITIPAGLTGGWSSSSYAPFTGCSNLSTAVFEEGMTKIPVGMFRDLASLTSISIPSTVTELGDWCFLNCTGLTSITIPKTITGGWSSSNYPPFSGCNYLNNITFGGIGSPITAIPTSLFKDITAATSITVYTTDGAALAGAPWGATNATITYLSA